MIDRTAILNLQADLQRERVITVTLTSGVWVTVDSIVGVQAESHAIIESDGRTVLIPLDKIEMIEIAKEGEEVLLEA